MSFACVRCGIATTELFVLELDGGDYYDPAMCGACKEVAKRELDAVLLQIDVMVAKGVHRRIAVRRHAAALDVAIHGRATEPPELVPV